MKRKLFGWPQNILANATGLTPSAICQIENGKRYPAITSVYKIANILGCSIDYLVKGVKYV